MKTKVMVMLLTLVFALGMMAQTATPVAPAATKTGDKCPMMKDGKMADGKSCCGDKCCTGDKCNMAAHKGQKTSDNQACCSGENGCCKDGKCEMAANKDGKGGCCGDKCPMMKKSDKPAA